MRTNAVHKLNAGASHNGQGERGITFSTHIPPLRGACNQLKFGFTGAIPATPHLFRGKSAVQTFDRTSLPSTRIEQL